jgi:hypothetical protein
MLAQIPVTVPYGQIFVNVVGLPRPGLLWSDDDNKQGFVWEDGIVCFAVPDHDGLCLIRVDVAQRIVVEASSLWAIRVPFQVPTAPMQIGVLGNTPNVSVPAGSYSLVFEALPCEKVDDQDYTYILDLKFCKDAIPDHEILKKGDFLETDKVLDKRGKFA